MRDMRYYLGLDLGTGSLKAVLFRASGIETASASADYPVYQPHNGWSEQDPEDWYRAAVKAVREIMEKSGVRPKDIHGIGLSGQMMGAVFLDKDGNVLRRAILWNDARTAQACRHLKEDIGDALFVRETLTPVRPGLTAAKVQWVRENEPEVFSRTAHLLLPKDYLRYRLTGEFATEVSDASATQFLDIPHRRWSKNILHALALDEAVLGQVYESQEITGHVHTKAARDLGILGGCPVAGGASDNAAAAVGMGVCSPGTAMTTIGTSGTVFACTDRPAPDRGQAVYTFCMPVPDTWHYMGSVNACGGSLKWWREQMYPEEVGYERLDADAASSVPGANRLFFLPYLNGEQSPHFNVDCRGAFIGLSSFHTRADMTRAVMEGATFALRDILTAIRDCGVEPDRMRLCGGGARSAFWRQLMSDVCGLPIDLPNMSAENSASLGAAILAMVAAGEYRTVKQACDRIVKIRKDVCLPDPAREELYRVYARRFDDLYPALETPFARILGLPEITAD